jgi:hypothetical protein
MTDVTNQIAQLNELLAKVQQQAAPLNAPPVSAWQQPTPAAALSFQGVGIPVSVQTPAGKVRCTFWLDASHTQTPAALMSAIEAMVNAGLPVDAWQQQNQQGGGNSWGGNNNNNGGGFRKRW